MLVDTGITLLKGIFVCKRSIVLEIPFHFSAMFYNAVSKQGEIFKNIYDSAVPTATLENT